MSHLAICPDTKVGALLEAYPALEPALIAIAPAFEKLRNPMLRRTVAKVATLSQAAKIGGLPVNELVRRLREAAGQVEPGVPQPAPPAESVETEPAWVATVMVAHEIDGDAMLEQGVHPIGAVRTQAARIGPGEAVRLATSFRPEPLIEAMRQAGLTVHSQPTPAGRWVTWFAK